jgi:hypothetical protein
MCRMQREKVIKAIIYDNPVVAELESDIGTSCISCGERALMAAPGEGGRESSLISHVPGMRATGKSQVAVKTIPWPNKESKSISERTGNLAHLYRKTSSHPNSTPRNLRRSQYTALAFARPRLRHGTEAAQQRAGHGPATTVMPWL